MKGYTKQKRHLKTNREIIKQKADERKQLKEKEETHEEPKIDIEYRCISVQTDLIERYDKISALQCAFSVLIAGATYTIGKKISIHMNEKFCSKSAFYEAQKIILQAVIKYADDSMSNARKNLSINAIVCGDGRYPIRRNSSHCSFDIIDIETNKIIAIGIVDKNSVYHPNETFMDTSNMLESEAMKRAIAQLGESKQKIKAFVIDGDNKNRTLLETKDFHPKILRDPNHLYLSFERYLNKELSENKHMVQDCNDCFRGIRGKITAWYSTLLYCDFDPEIKKFAWSSTVGHLIGDHSECIPHEPCQIGWKIGVENPVVAVKLNEILDKRTNDFDLTMFKATTNLNESFHNEQLIYDDKTVSFPISQEIRDKLALLRHNEGLMFEIQLRKKLNLPDLEPANLMKITAMDSTREETKIIRHTTVYRNIERIYRKHLSESHKKQKLGDYKRDTDSDYDSGSSE